MHLKIASVNLKRSELRLGMRLSVAVFGDADVAGVAPSGGAD